MNSFCLLAQDSSAQLVGVWFVLVILFWVIALAATIFWLWMLIDALTHEPTTNDKILWVLVIGFLHLIGALIYFFVRRSQRRTALR